MDAATKALAEWQPDEPTQPLSSMGATGGWTPFTRPGTKVRLRGLQSKPELNGHLAMVLSPEHSKEAAAGYAKGRVPVQLIGDDRAMGGTMQVKPESLEIVEAIESATSEYDAKCSTAWSLFEQGTRRASSLASRRVWQRR